MKKVRSLLALLLVLAIVLPGGAFAAPNKQDVPAVQLPAELPAFVEPDPELELPANLRVIVEMEDAPVALKLAGQNLTSMSLNSNDLNSMVQRSYNLQQSVLSGISSAGVQFEPLNQFAVSFNGFSGFIPRENLDALRSVPGVKAVHLAQEYVLEQPDMAGSVNMIGALPTWDLDIKGQGTVVAVLDSGIDAFHKDFATNPLEAPKLDKAFVDGTGLPGAWLNEKVPYGYNYYDKNSNPKDSSAGGQHGQHVAGTVGANGDLKGVAPETQILGMKVFGNDPSYQSTWTDIYIKAIDDSLILRADAINMSLGSPAGFDTDAAMERALNAAYDTGVIISISAGNEHTLYQDAPSIYLPYPFYKNPDVGLVGSPSATYNSLSVASWDNAYTELKGFKFYPEGGETAATLRGHLPPNPHNDPTGMTNIEIVFAQYGVLDSEYDGLDVEGKFVLVYRGLPAGAPDGTDAGFRAKALRAQSFGAVGVIVANNQGGDATMIMGALDDVMFPATMISQNNGNALVAALADAPQYVSFYEETLLVHNPATTISSFSSWGPTPNLKMKPEITAPGGNITSLQNDDTYGVMSGTSMAAPHVAGGLALVQQYLSSEDAIALFGALSNTDRSTMAKNLLMNTAVPGTEPDGWLYKVRVQGSGMMDLHGAVTTTTTLVNRDNGLAKVELGDFTETQFTLPLRLTNYSDVAKTYTWADDRNTPDEVADGVHVIRDDIRNFAGLPTFLMEWSAPVEVSVTGLADSITVEPGASVDLDVVIDFAADEFYQVFENQFIEGFVMLKDEGDQRTSIPFLGFVGDYDALDVLDLQRNNPESQFQMTGLLTDDYYFYGAEAQISPILNRGVASEQKSVTPVYTHLRNANEIKYVITNEDGEVLRQLSTEQYPRKHFRLGLNNPYRIKTAARWDGMIEGVVAADGLYNMTALITPTREGSEVKVHNMPVRVDTVAPQVSDLTVEGSNVSFTMVDPNPGTGIGNDGHVNQTLAVEPAFILNKDLGTKVDIEVEAAAVAGTPQEVTVDVSTLVRDGVPTNLEIHLWDNATNESITPIDPSSFDDDESGKYLYIWVNTPAMWSFNEYETATSGYVWGYSSLEGLYISVNGGEEVPATIEFRESIDVRSATNQVYQGPGWVFNANLNLEDGYQEVRYRAVALDGTEDSIVRRFFVDKLAPTLEVTQQPRKTTDPAVTFDVNMADNFEYLRLTINDNEVYLVDETTNEMGQIGIQKSASFDYDLQPGENTFVFKLYDAADNVTTKTVIVFYGTIENPIEEIFGETRYHTAVETSKKAFEAADTVVLASGENFPDALSAGPLAYAMNSPILLSQKDTIPTVVMDEFKRLGTKKVLIIGGELALSKNVEQQLANAGITFDRLAGNTRYETAFLIGQQLSGMGGDMTTAFLVSGENYPDAVAVGIPAARMGAPILLTGKTGVPNASLRGLNDWGINDVYVIGGNLVIEDSVINSLSDKYTVERVAGDNRYATSVTIAERFMKDAAGAAFTSGENYPDALTGGVYGAQKNYVLLLVNTKGVPAEVAKYVTDNNIYRGIIFGGELAIPAAVRTQILNLLQ